MVHFSTKYRSTEPEIMDDVQLKGKEMQILLTDLHRVNSYLGGFQITLDGIKQLLSLAKKKTFSIVDFGCGDGEMLRRCANFASERKLHFKLLGIDANDHILDEARKRSANFPTIEYKTIDVFKNNEAIPRFDVGLFTLFLHHFPNEKIVELLNSAIQKTKYGLIVNDLQRNHLAFTLFKGFGPLFLKTKTAQHDGLVSIARGFTENDLKAMASKIDARHSIKQKWAFRHQWIIEKI